MSKEPKENHKLFLSPLFKIARLPLCSESTSAPNDHTPHSCTTLVDDHRCTVLGTTQALVTTVHHTFTGYALDLLRKDASGLGSLLQGGLALVETCPRWEQLVQLQRPTSAWMQVRQSTPIFPAALYNRPSSCMSMCHLISQTVVAHLTVGWMDPTMCKGILVALGTTFSTGHHIYYQRWHNGSGRQQTFLLWQKVKILLDHSTCTSTGLPVFFL